MDRQEQPSTLASERQESGGLLEPVARVSESPAYSSKSHRTQLLLASPPTPILFSASDLLTQFTFLPFFLHSFRAARGQLNGLVTEQGCAAKWALL